jgi:hypothetical protein
MAKNKDTSLSKEEQQKFTSLKVSGAKISLTMHSEKRTIII